jgi:hypothetical protein
MNARIRGYKASIWVIHLRNLALLTVVGAVDENSPPMTDRLSKPIS